MRGSLEQAIADATYKQSAHFPAHAMEYYNYSINHRSGHMFEGGQSIWIIAGTAVFFGITYYASGYEHRCYISRKRELTEPL